MSSTSRWGPPRQQQTATTASAAAANFAQAQADASLMDTPPHSINDAVATNTTTTTATSTAATTTTITTTTTTPATSTKGLPPAVTVTDYEILTEVEWGPSKDDPAYDTDQELAPKPRKRVDVCNCSPPPPLASNSTAAAATTTTTNIKCCLDSSCILFACQEECSAKHCPAGMACGNRRLQQPDTWPPTEIFDAGPHKGRGLRVLQSVQPGDVICEYTGQAVLQKHLSKLFRRYQLDRRLYIMALGDGVYLDARAKGGKARFINHSCEPNCRVERWKVKGILRAAVVAIRPVAAYEELTFDYQWERQRGRAPTVCHCHAPTCRGTLEMPKSMEELAMQQELQGHWKRGISRVNNNNKNNNNGSSSSSTTTTSDGGGVVAADQTLVNRVVQVYSQEHGEYFLGEVTGYNDEDKKHCILYHQDLKEVWEDLSNEEWMVLDDAMDKEHFHIAKKAQRQRTSSSLLKDHHASEMGPASKNIKDYIYVQTPIKEALLSKIHVAERCQRNCGVQLSTQAFSRPPLPVNQDDPEDVEKYQALDQSLDGLVWKITLTGSDVPKAYGIVTKSIAYFEKKLADDYAAEMRSKTPPPSAAMAEMIFPRHLNEAVKRKLPILLREKCRNNVTFQLAPADSKEYSRLILEACLVSDLQAAKEHVWHALVALCVDLKVPMALPLRIPKHLGFLAGKLTQKECHHLLVGYKSNQSSDDDSSPYPTEDWATCPFVQSFASTNRCTIWMQCQDDQGQTENSKPSCKIFLGCSPTEIPRLWEMIQSRVQEVTRGVRYYHLGTDRVFQPMLMKNGGEFFRYVRFVTGGTVTVDSMTGDHLKIDGKKKLLATIENAKTAAQPISEEAAQFSEEDRARLAEEMVRLQIELYRDNAIREYPRIFGRDWTLSAAKHTSSSNEAESSKALGQLDMISASHGATDIAEMVARLDLPRSVAAHAVIILYRFVTVKQGMPSQTKLREALLACVFLANKSQKVVKWNKLDAILEAGYKTLYQSAAFDRKNEEAAALEERVIAAEAEILEALDYDIFWCDVEFLQVAAAGTGEIGSTFVTNIFDFAFSGQVLSAGAELWLKYGPDYVFAASAAFLKANLDKLVPALSLIPLKVSQAAELIAETAKLGTPRTQFSPSHPMLENGKDRLQQQVSDIKHACMEMMKKTMVPGSVQVVSRTSVSSQRYKIIAQQSRIRRKLTHIPKELVSTTLLPALDGISIESSANIFLETVSSATTDVILEGHWRAVAVAEMLVRLELGENFSPGTSSDYTLDQKERVVMQVKSQPGLINAELVQASSGWEGTVGCTNDEKAATTRLGGKSCIPGKIKESSLRQAGLRWWITPKHGPSTTGSLINMHLFRFETEPLQALASIASAVMGEADDFQLLQSIAMTNGNKNGERSVPVSLQRWPPEKVGNRESKTSSKSNDRMQIGFSPVALQELQLMTQLHRVIPSPQGHPNFILPTAIAMPQENDADVQPSSQENKPVPTLSPFDDPSVLSLFRSTNVNQAAETDKKVQSSPHIVHEPAPFTLQRFLSRRIRETDDLAISPVILLAWCHDLLSALVHCHTNHVVVRTLQPDQMIVDHAGVIKLGSLYRCTVLSEKDRKRTLNVLEAAKSSKKKDSLDENIPPLAAPEHLLGCPTHSKESDVWSIGCLLASLLLNRPLFIGKDCQSFLLSQFKVVGVPSKKNFEQGKRMPKYKKPPKKYPPGVERALQHMLKDRAPQFEKIIDLIARMLQLDPSKRCTAAEALGHDCMVEYMEKCNSDRAFCQAYVNDWLDLKKAMIQPDGSEQMAERTKKRQAMIAAASAGAKDENDVSNDDLYDMDDLIDMTLPKKRQKTA